MQITVSHKTIIGLVDKLGENFDSLVKEWRDSFIPSLMLPEVKSCISSSAVYSNIISL